VDHFSVILKPLVSEKSAQIKDVSGKYSFLVHLKATKADVKRAIEDLFGVNVVGVNTSITRGKVRRRGMFASLDPKKKKAIVQLASGQKIKALEVE